jgi:hypothetical protein
VLRTCENVLRTSIRDFSNCRAFRSTVAHFLGFAKIRCDQSTTTAYLTPQSCPACCFLTSSCSEWPKLQEHIRYWSSDRKDRTGEEACGDDDNEAGAGFVLRHDKKVRTYDLRPAPYDLPHARLEAVSRSTAPRRLTHGLAKQSAPSLDLDPCADPSGQDYTAPQMRRQGRTSHTKQQSTEFSPRMRPPCQAAAYLPL